MVGGHLPKKIYVFLIMMKYDDLYFASRYNFFDRLCRMEFSTKNLNKSVFEKNGYTWFWLAAIDIHVINKKKEKKGMYIVQKKKNNIDIVQCA